MNIKSGIILAGGTGSRLYPLTHSINKHLVPLGDKFIIDYPINTLKQIGVTDLTVVLGGNHFSQIVSHLKNGRQYEMDISYCYQENPEGIAHAINLCKKFVDHSDSFAIILGDNIFENKIQFKDSNKSAQITLCEHKELNRFGVASVKKDKIVKIEEKPKTLNNKYTNLAITGCYLFDQKFFEYFSKMKKSARGEYEITDIINSYNNDSNLDYTFVDGLWSDAGTHESIAFLNNFFYQKSQ